MHIIINIILIVTFFFPFVADGEILNGSFESGENSWDITGFQLTSSVLDMHGTEHFPTDGDLMMNVTDRDGELVQYFTAGNTDYALSFDRNLIDPYSYEFYCDYPFAFDCYYWDDPLFPFDPVLGKPDLTDDISAMVFWIIVKDSAGTYILFDILPHVANANEWETVTINLSNLVVGSSYKMEIQASPNGISCPAVVGIVCPQVVFGGNVLIDNVRLSGSGSNCSEADNNNDIKCQEVTGTRALPSCAEPGTDIDVSMNISIDEAYPPGGLIVSEYVPIGWTINSTVPAHTKEDALTGEIGWVFLGNDVIDRVIKYSLHIPDNQPVDEVRTSNGELKYNDSADNSLTISSGGDFEIEISQNCIPFHHIDQNHDWKIGDFELLDALDKWASRQLGDFELLDLIDFWAEECFQWDGLLKKYMTGC